MDAGVNKYRSKDFAGAIVYYDKVLELDSNNADAYNGRAVCENDLKDYAGAKADCNKAIELNPSYKEPYNNLAFAMQYLGDYSGSLTNYNKAIELDPQNVALYDNRGVLKGVFFKDYGLSAIQTGHRFLGDCRPKDNLAGFYLSHPGPNIESGFRRLAGNCPPANLPESPDIPVSITRMLVPPNSPSSCGSVPRQIVGGTFFPAGRAVDDIHIC